MKHLELAAKIALLSRCAMRHGVVIAKGSRVLSIGVNSTKTHPRARKVGNTIHAELAALIASSADVRGATLYSARVLRSGELGNSKPCRWCAELLGEYGINRVVYCGQIDARLEALRNNGLIAPSSKLPASLRIRPGLRVCSYKV